MPGLVIEKRIKVAEPIIASPYWDDIPQGVPIEEHAECQYALECITRDSSPALFLGRFSFFSLNCITHRD
jgi:hypothetical protein